MESNSDRQRRKLLRLNVLPKKFPGVGLDAFVVMPNHVHGVIFLGADPEISSAVVREQGGPACPPGPQDGDPSPDLTLSTIVQWFKTMTTNDYIAGVNHMGWPRYNRHICQRGYHDRIVRSDRELDNIRAYIHNYPATWHQDVENPAIPAPSV